MPKINKGERNKRGSGTRMKREYVKPVIESEEFVANEYVASCWIVHCSDCDQSTLWYGSEPNWGYNDADPFMRLNGIQMYTDSINGVEPEEHKSYSGEWWWQIIQWLFGWQDKSYYHTVDVQLGDNGLAGEKGLSTNHPNASA